MVFFYISPDKVPWATNSVPWATNSVPWDIWNYCPWDFKIISTIAHDGVLARKISRGYSEWPTGILLQSRTWVVYSVPHGTLSDCLRYSL
jgi:hypothetical protein